MNLDAKLTELLPFEGIYKNTPVLVTGHTGFKGSWLCQWLLELGAEVHGYALKPEGVNPLFDQLHLAKLVNSEIADIRDFEGLKEKIEKTRPAIIFHLAAQSLVRPSYEQPLETIQVNTLGTVNLLEAVRQIGRPTAVVAITTDKCYENKEWLFGYREPDAMGGHDPYSASKGAAELLISSYRNSFFHTNKVSDHQIRIASVRAGNVIGGGDWALDRIVPDCIRDLTNSRSIAVRNPGATRPWQHVLEPLGGYLRLGQKLLNVDDPELGSYCESFNFGPLVTNNRTVRELVETVIKCWGSGEWEDQSDPSAVHEASLLSLTIDKAYHKLNWIPAWDFDETIHETVSWYKNHQEGQKSNKEFTINQITNYQSKMLEPTSNVS